MTYKALFIFPPKRLIDWVYDIFKEFSCEYEDAIRYNNSNPVKFILLKKLDLLDGYYHGSEDYPWLWKPSWKPNERFQGDLDIMKMHFFDMDWEWIYSYPSAVPLIQIRLNLLEEFKIRDGTDWKWLSANPDAIYILEKYPDKIFPELISINPSAFYLLQKHPDKINWSMICKNPNPLFISLLQNNIDKINWNYLCRNTHPLAIELIEQNLDKLDRDSWSTLSANSGAICLLEQNQDKIDWSSMSKNSNAIHLLEKNLDKICWRRLSCNPSAIYILEKNLEVCDEGTTDQISWSDLSANPGAIQLLEQNKDQMDEHRLFSNPAIFEWCRIKYLHKGKIFQIILYRDLYTYMREF